MPAPAPALPAALPMIAPKPAPAKVPIAAPFSLVDSGSEQAKKNRANKIVERVVTVLCISRSLKTPGMCPRRCPLIKTSLSFPSICFHPLGIQLLHQRDHGLGEELFRVAPTALLQPRFQIVHARLAGDIIGIRHIEVVRREKAGDPMLDDLVDDLVQLVFRIALVVLER